MSSSSTCRASRRTRGLLPASRSERQRGAAGTGQALEAQHPGDSAGELTMLECTVACSMYLAMPVTKAFLSSKFVSKLACGQDREMGIKTQLVVCSLTWDALAKSRISRAPGAWEELVNYLGCCTSRSEVVSYIDTP